MSLPKYDHDNDVGSFCRLSALQSLLAKFYNCGGATSGKTLILRKTPISHSYRQNAKNILSLKERALLPLHPKLNSLPLPGCSYAPEEEL